MTVTRDDLIRFFHHRFSLDVSAMDDEDPLFSSGMLDSMNVAEVVAYLEDRSGRMMLPADLSFDNFDTLGRILRFAAALESRSS
jgi:acyl carrier protein